VSKSVYASAFEQLARDRRMTQEDERAFRGERVFHGGVRGLAVGDILLPPSMTGATPFTQWSCRSRRVYFSNLDRARFQALASYGRQPLRDRGWVYKVRPVGRVQADPDEAESWCSPTAEIVQVVERGVSSWKGMTFDGIIDWAYQNGDYAERPSMEIGFSFTLRAHQLGLENALRMQRRERARGVPA
jgi:hypothetical protein